jgi:class 3 adenylate cyclase
VSGDPDRLIVAPGTAAEQAVAVPGRLFVGRECAGIEPRQRLILNEPSISRDHFELRSDSDGMTRLIDHSTNGTWVNGRRVERGEPVTLGDGDRVEVGELTLEFRASAAASSHVEADLTIRTAGVIPLAVVVGDVIGYTAMTERHGAEPVARTMEAVFGSLQELLGKYRGTVGNYVGDALFAAWDTRRDEHALANAIGFALDAAQLASEFPSLDDAPLRMGWAVTFGEAVAGRPALSRDSLHGDAVNLAFRLASLAGREGLPDVLVTAEVADQAPEAAAFAPLEELRVKGRAAPVRAYEARR